MQKKRLCEKEGHTKEAAMQGGKKGGCQRDNHAINYKN